MFKIGQKVICIKSHSKNLVTKGNTYTITNSYNLNCGCRVVSVGILSNGLYAKCTTHNTRTLKNTNEYSFLASLFAPIEEKGSTYIEAYIDITKQKIEKININ